MKATAIAPSNIALIKYWGKAHETLRIPANTNISINLSNLKTTTTVEFSPKYQFDHVSINNMSHIDTNQRVSIHLNRIKKLKHINYHARVVSKSNFPIGAGLASSASGFAALTVAALKALNISLTEQEISSLARLGSGSACRSIPDGIVEWKKGNNHSSSYAHTLYKPDYLSISIIAVILEDKEKKAGSSIGMKNLQDNIFFNTRLKNLNIKLKEIKQAIQVKNYHKMFMILEQEALELHAIVMTTPPFNNLYWSPKTIRFIQFIWNLRKKGVPVYFTIDAGPNVSLFCENKYEKNVLKELQNEKYIKQIIVNKPSIGTRIINNHLF